MDTLQVSDLFVSKVRTDAQVSRSVPEIADGTIVFDNSDETWAPAGQPEMPEFRKALTSKDVKGDVTLQLYKVLHNGNEHFNFPPQLVVVVGDYIKPHDYNLVLKSPDVAAQEVVTYSKGSVVSSSKSSRKFVEE